jgi:YD repeat-containing protein
VRSIGGNTWQRATNVPAFAANIYRPYSGYRGWGYFGYNAGASTASGLTSIKRLELVTSKKLTESKLDKQSIDNLKGKPEQLQAYIDQNQNQLYDPKTEKLVYLVPAITDTSYGYMGQDEFTWVHGDTLSSSRLGADDIMGLLTLLGGSAKAPQKIAYNSSTYLSGGASAGGFAAGGGASYTYTFGGIARNDVDFIDLNGDRYPDFVRKGDIQFTRANGSLEERYVPNIFNSISGSDYYTHGLTASASFNTSHSKPYSFAVGSGQSKVGVQVGGGSNSLGLSGGFSKGFNEASYALVDINGDGLPDRLEKDGSVVLNLGYGFADHRENWRYGQIHKGGGESYSAGMGYTFANGSLEAGASLATGYNHVEGELIDINGDGLPDDVVKLNDGIKVRFNTGSGFGEQLPWPGLRAINVNTSTTLSFHAGFTFGVFFPIPILPLGGVKLVINPQVHFDFEQSRIIEDIRDINGDGFPDVISSNDKGEYLAANLSKIGRTNMLQAVIQPLGSSFVLDYKREGNTYDMPNSIWTLSKVIVRDGFNGDGADSLMTTFVYDSGYYSQREREFYGFRKVTTREHNTLNKNLVYRSNASTYINDNYYLKGLMEAQLVLDSAGRIYTRNDSRYELRNATSVLGEAYSRRPEMPLVGGVSQNDFDWAFPALKETVQSFYEGQAIAGMVSRMTFDSYDQYGNITQYTDFGNPAKPEDDLTSLITYQYITDNNKYIVGLPSNIRVLSNGKDYRVRSAAYDPVTGKPISMTMSGNPSRAAVYSMEYDGYGNIRKLTRPENGKGQRLTIEYTYDNSVNTFPVKVKNSYGDSSTAAYDYRFGQVLETTDPNGNRILNEIDALGRITKLTGPYELAAGAPYTIQFDYHPEAAMPFAISRHFDPSNPSNPLQTITFVDGLGRVIQAKKDISMFQGDGLPDKEMLTVSGKILYDGLGRPTHTFYPFAEDKGSETRLNPQSASSKPATVTTYDVLDRPVALTLADGAVTTSSYGFGNDRSNTQQFKTRAVDANGVATEQFTNIRGLVTATKNSSRQDGDIWTSFEYDPVNQQIAYTNNLGHKTTMKYDLLGRCVERNHPDAGLSSYKYDPLGNIVEMYTANRPPTTITWVPDYSADPNGPARFKKVISPQDGIKYTYDYERLTDIIYPENPENNVHYEYGKNNAGSNRNGRIVSQTDATGVQEYFYGPLGEITRNVRTIVIPGRNIQTFTTEWRYDTWNRLDTLIYPDGEKLVYQYNTGGLLNRLVGDKQGNNYTYISQTGYDLYESKVFLAYGNSVKTSYSYDSLRRRLSNVTAATATGRKFINTAYEYDKVNNILKLDNNAQVPSTTDLIGGSSKATYSYDDLYRLTAAQQYYFPYLYDNYVQHYATSRFSYNSVGGFLNKNQYHTKRIGSGLPQVQPETSYGQEYTYGTDHPNAPVRIGNKYYGYDANGNMNQVRDTISGLIRHLAWDEDNRLMGVLDDTTSQINFYDASGTRVLKGSGSSLQVYVNGVPVTSSGQIGTFDVYVNPFVVLRGGTSYTKHYFVEGTRIASKLGGGFQQDPVLAGKAAGFTDAFYNNKKLSLENAIKKILNLLLGLAPADTGNSSGSANGDPSF